MNPVVGLDIGTTKVCVCVGKETKEGIEITGIGMRPCTGLHRGMVSNIRSTVQAIESAMAKAELMAGESIDRVVVGISGGSIKGISSLGVIAISKGREVTKQDVERVIETAKAISLPNGVQILHLLPQSFRLDDQDGIEDPIGMSGMKLESEIYIVTASTTAVQNLAKCVERSGFEMVGQPVLGLLAASLSILSHDEKRLGVALVDIGGGTTDIGIFIEGNLNYVSSLSLGGNNITKDISIVLRTSLEDAERVKRKAGSCLSSQVEDDEEVSVASLGDGKPQTLPKHTISEIIEPRMEEIFSLVNEEIKGFKKQINAGVVLTGGGALLSGVVELGQQIFDLPVRIGVPKEVKGLASSVSSSIYATPVGLVIYGIRNREKVLPSGTMSRMIERIKNFFKELFE
jgi:cell division protein FtsA